VKKTAKVIDHITQEIKQLEREISDISNSKSQKKEKNVTKSNPIIQVKPIISKSKETKLKAEPKPALVIDLPKAIVVSKAKLAVTKATRHSVKPKSHSKD
jgi:CTP synthase (UTP-ammonia lyase)